MVSFYLNCLFKDCLQIQSYCEVLGLGLLHINWGWGKTIQPKANIIIAVVIVVVVVANLL